MNCPKCYGKTAVVGVEHTPEMTIRYLKCKVCGRTYFSKETIPVGMEACDIRDKFNECHRNKIDYAGKLEKAKEKRKANKQATSGVNRLLAFAFTEEGD